MENGKFDPNNCSQEEEELLQLLFDISCTKSALRRSQDKKRKLLKQYEENGVEIHPGLLEIL